MGDSLFSITKDNGIMTQSFLYGQAIISIATTNVIQADFFDIDFKVKKQKKAVITPLS